MHRIPRQLHKRWICQSISNRVSDQSEIVVKTLDGICLNLSYSLAYKGHLTVFQAAEREFSEGIESSLYIQVRHLLSTNSYDEECQRGYQTVRLISPSVDFYQQSQSNLQSIYRLPYRLVAGLVLGGIGPGLIWVAISQIIMSRFCPKTSNSGYNFNADLRLATPGFPMYFRYGLEVGVVAYIIYTLCSLWLCPEPDSNNATGITALTWGLPYAIYLERLGKVGTIVKE